MRIVEQFNKDKKHLSLRPYLLFTSIAIITFSIQALCPVTTSTDSAWTFHLAASFLREHNFDLDEYRSIIDLQLDYRMRVVGGHIYSYYPVATPLLVAPTVWFTNKIYPLFYPTDFYTYLARHAPNNHTANMEKLLASGIVGLAAGLIFIIAQWELGTLESITLALIFAFSTSMWSTSSRALWQHGPSALFLALALLLIKQVVKKDTNIFWIGLILGYAYLIRPTNSLAVAFFGLYILINYRQRFWLYMVGAAVVLMPYVANNWLAYHNLFPPYSYQLFERLASPKVFGEALFGTLVSPSRGLFIFSPVLLFSLFGAYFRISRNPLLSNLDIYLAGIIVSHWWITSLFEDWGGAWSIGPRYFVDILPFLIYFLIPFFQKNVFSLSIWKLTFLTAILVSTMIQAHCSTSIYPFMWNGKPRALVEAPERKWDWGDVQFLRGFCKNNPLEGRAPACWFSLND
jgi:hypothetical protein